MDDFETALAGMRQALVDLDGDGRPDATVLVPVEPEPLQQSAPAPAPAASSNAMAQGSRRPQPQPQNFEGVRQEANNAMRPVAPAQPVDESQSWEEWANDPSFNEGRGRYGLVPSVVRGLSSASNAMKPVMNPDGPLSGINRYIERSGEALGRAPRQIMEMSPTEAAQNAMAAAAAIPPLGGPSRAGAAFTTARETPDVFRGATTGNWSPVHEASRVRETTIMRAPPHTLQTRNAKGQFEKLEGETREIRDKAIRERARVKENPDYYRQQYDQSGEPLGSKAARDYLSKI